MRGYSLDCLARASGFHTLFNFRSDRDHLNHYAGHKQWLEGRGVPTAINHAAGFRLCLVRSIYFGCWFLLDWRFTEGFDVLVGSSLDKDPVHLRTVSSFGNHARYIRGRIGVVLLQAKTSQCVWL